MFAKELLEEKNMPRDEMRRRKASRSRSPTPASFLPDPSEGVDRLGGSWRKQRAERGAGAVTLDHWASIERRRKRQRSLKTPAPASRFEAAETPEPPPIVRQKQKGRGALTPGAVTPDHWTVGAQEHG